MAETSSQAPSLLVGRILDGRVATLTLNRPERKNAMGPAEWQALATALAEITGDRSANLRAVLLRGAGGAFCAGGDLRSMPERLELPLPQREAQLRNDAQVICMLYELELAVVAEIDGPCMGAGLALALACDLRIASENARFGAVFHRVGLTADFGLSWLLPRVIGPARSSDLLLTAEVLDAAQAREAGLVQRVVPAERLSEQTQALCQRLADGPPLAQATSKRSLRRSADSSLRAAIDWEAQAQALLGKTDDAREGVAAFNAKRPPRFRGQ